MATVNNASIRAEIERLKQCPNCSAKLKGNFPQDMQGKLQYASGLKAFVTHLIISQMVALNRDQKINRGNDWFGSSRDTPAKYVFTFT